MATEDELRDKQIAFLAAEIDLAKAKAWTPSLVDVSRLVIEVLNDKYSSITKRDIAGATDEVMAVLQAVQKRLIQPGLWAQTPTAAPPAPGEFVR